MSSTPLTIPQAIARVTELDQRWRDQELEARIIAHYRIRAIQEAIAAGASVSMIADALDVHSSVIVQLASVSNGRRSGTA
jgi:transposase-like protein